MEGKNTQLKPSYQNNQSEKTTTMETVEKITLLITMDDYK